MNEEKITSLDLEKFNKFLQFIDNTKLTGRSFVIEYNPHAPYFDSKEYFDSYHFPSEEIKKKCDKENHVWTVEFWNSTVTTISIADYSLTDALKRFLECFEIKDNSINIYIGEKNGK